jgi:transcriptional regulator with GAF, ATPase, and Fis domain
MRFQSLTSKMVVPVSVLVISSGLLISALVSRSYRKSILETMYAQAENVAHAVALEAADQILTNDLVALQKMLDHHTRSHPNISFLFIEKDGQILAHTFREGLPAGLLKANTVVPGGTRHFQKLASISGKQYLDIAWPIFQGKAGVLRLGFSETPYRHKLAKLWLQISGLTLLILFLARGGSLLFMRRITRPLGALDQAVQKVDKGEVGVRVEVRGEDEVGRLAASFNHMFARMEAYTGKLEEQTMELERAHHQTRTFCGIVQEMGALRSLKEIGSFLIERFQHIFKCGQMVLLVFSGHQDLLFALSKEGVKALKEKGSIQTAGSLLEGMEKVTFTNKMPFEPPLVPENFKEAARQAIVPLQHENKPLGALVIACPGDCTCNFAEIDSAALILSQAARVIRRALLQEEEIRDLQNRLDSNAEFGGIVGKDPQMQIIYRLIEDIAPTDATVLIEGESGTGKELVARAIYQLSSRKDKPFVVINCSAYPATLLESELFGHEKGAFTGAIRQKLGRFEQADGGTVFLDEIGEIPLSAQIKLLRVLQSQKFERLGGEKTLTVNVRILAATNRNLLHEVKRGQFREDLYYRLNVIPVHLPPLRERSNDIPLLARHFLRRFAEEQGKDVAALSHEAMRMLLDYAWPGNVRELENSIEHATVLAKGGRIEVTDLPVVIHSAASYVKTSQPTSMEEHERILLQEALEECGWNKKLAASRLGISRNTLYVKLKKYQIVRPTTH